MKASFDVVVVGGGAAGCVVAARLAELPSRSVLLLEAGPDRRADLPAELRDGWGIERDLFDWGYQAEPGADGAVTPVRRKKLLGGTSWLTRFATRGSPADYDEWEALGNPGWGFADLLPYFVRLETDDDFGDDPWHGASGPMPVTRYHDLEYTDVVAAGLEALDAAGFPPVDDHNRPGAVGAGRMPMSSRNGLRVTTADAYVPPCSTPPNLTIRGEAPVAAVLFDGISACGVRLVDGTVIEAGWVVICAGTYGSPPLLMRSGLGPAEHLRSNGISVRVDLPGVGASLADHPSVDVELAYQGSVRKAPVLHSIATFHSSEASSESPPDLMLWLSDPEDAESFAISVMLLKPRSKGSVWLRFADPVEPPSIALPSLSDPYDVARLVEGYRRAIEVASAPRLRPFCSEPPALPDEDALRARIRAEVYSVPHVVGTCAMGPRPEDGAVVDSFGSVHGTERLTIADASITPDSPSAFTHFPTIMIGERLSEQVASRLDGPD